MALQVGELEPAEAAQKDRRAVALRHHDGAEIVERLDGSNAAPVTPELAAGPDAAAGACAVCSDGGFDIRQRQVEPHELLRIEFQLKLSRDAAEVRNVGDARHLFERRDHNPALDLGKLALSFGV